MEELLRTLTATAERQRLILHQISESQNKMAYIFALRNQGTDDGTPPTKSQFSNLIMRLDSVNSSMTLQEVKLLHYSLNVMKILSQKGQKV